MYVSEINIYPVKSLKGIRLESAAVEKRGLVHDRRWLLVDENGVFLTQRENPRMATVGVEITDVGIRVSADGAGHHDVVPLNDSDRVTVKVWDSESEATVYDAHTNEWFSDALGQRVSLLYMPEDAGRPVSERFNRGGEKVSFADGYPLLVIGEASLGELNRRIGEASGTLAVQSEEEASGTVAVQLEAEDAGRLPAVRRLPMKRFRPNIVVTGSEAFAEDGWNRIRVGEAIFRVVKPCARCVITTVDHEKGEFDGKEPLKTMATFRMANQVFPDTYESFGHSPNSVLFGENLIPENPGVVMNRDDEVEVLEFR